MAYNQKEVEKKNLNDRNPDPITGAPGAHPMGTGAGAVAAGAAGAAIGAVAGPVGALAGAAIGAIAGGLAGKGVAEYFDPTAEAKYWRETYSTRPYYNKSYTFEDYDPAYRYGWESRTRHKGRNWTEVESDLGRDWDKTRGTSRLQWEEARHATRDAWDRIETDPTTGKSRLI